MKGLLIKDFYMIGRYCRSMVLILVVFLAVSVINPASMFFSLYPSLLCGMIPVTLLSYDERSRWAQYCGAFPYDRKTVVSGKYVIAAVMVAAATLLCITVIAIRFAAAKTPMSGADVLGLAEIMCAAGLFAPAFCLPFMFRYGVEKGRMAYYGVIVLFFGGCAALTRVDAGEAVGTLSWGSHVILLASVVVFALSWAIATAVYSKREL